MKRWIVIRHLRYFYNKWQVLRWYDMWAEMGMHSGNMEHDIRVLDAIWRGER